MSKSLIRNLAMLALIPKYPSSITTVSLQNELREKGFDISIRSIQRDLELISSILPLTSETSEVPYRWSFIGKESLLFKKKISHEMRLNKEDDEGDIVQSIFQTVSREFNTDIKSIKAESKSIKDYLARDIAIYMVREITGFNYPAISQYFDRSSPVSIKASCGRIKEQMNRDHGFTLRMEQLIGKISGHD